MKSAKITPTINETTRIPIFSSLLCGFSALICGFSIFIRHSSSRLKKSRAEVTIYLYLQTTMLGGSDRPLFLIFPLILLVQKRISTDFVQQQAQLISLVLCTALIGLAFR